MVDFFVDAFVDTDTTLLQDHVSDSGHAWFASFAGGTNNLRIQNNRVWIDGSSYRYANAQVDPPSADYQVEARIRVLSLSGSVGPIIRAESNTAAYVALYSNNPSQVRLFRLSTGGAHTQIGSAASLSDPAINDLVTIRIKVEGTSIQVFVDDVLEIDETDSNITAAGRGGIRLQSAMSTTSGLHVEEMRAFTGEAVGPVTGTLDETEEGDDTTSIAVASSIAGSLNVTEQEDDTLSLVGGVSIEASLDATEQEDDAADLTGAVAVDATLAATEQGNDTAEIEADAFILSEMFVSEEGADTFAGTGTTTNAVFGLMAASEQGNDELGTLIELSVEAFLTAIEAGSDTATIGDRVLYTSIVGDLSLTPVLGADVSLDLVLDGVISAEPVLDADLTVKPRR